MAFYKCIILLQGILQTVIFMTIITRNFADNKNVKNFGLHTVDYKEFKTCAGPKSKNLSLCYVELLKVKDDYMANITINFLTQCRIDNVKVRAYRAEKDQKTNLINYNIDDPCNHFAFAAVVNNYFTTHGCIVKKGIYNINLNLSNITRIFYGDSFFYGEFLTKSIITSKQGNICCFVAHAIFKKAN